MIRRAMYDPDLDLSRRFLLEFPPPGEVLLCAVTGSHHYGFPSPDSDIDIKGIHLAPTEQLLGIENPKEHHDRLLVFEGVECDLTTHEARMAISLLLKGNGNLLERIFSPYQLFENEHVDALRVLAGSSLSRRSYHHYAGYFRGMQKEHQRAEPHAKSLLYTFRVALTGIHLLETGEVVAHLPTLAPLYELSEVLELVERKVTTREKVVLTEAESKYFSAHWPALEERLGEARDGSALPEQPPNRGAAHDWLVARRMESLGRTDPRFPSDRA